MLQWPGNGRKLKLSSLAWLELIKSEANSRSSACIFAEAFETFVLGGLGAQCLPYPEKGALIRDIVKWFEGEVKSIPETFTQLNKNSVALALAGMLRMLHESGCEHLSMLSSLASSSDTSLLDEIPTEVQKIAGRLVHKWWTDHGLPEALHRLRKEPESVSFGSQAF
jgi:hypothetical protein